MEEPNLLMRMFAAGDEPLGESKFLPQDQEDIVH